MRKRIENAGSVFVSGMGSGSARKNPPDTMPRPKRLVITGPATRTFIRGFMWRSRRAIRRAEKEITFCSVANSTFFRRMNAGSRGRRRSMKAMPISPIAIPNGVERPGMFGIRNGAARKSTSSA